MRIYGNRPIKTLPGQATRPTPARVREALFNIWQGTINGCRWLDLCAGSGAMGAEALCRGANLVVGIEKSSQACAIILENWQKVVKPDCQEFRLLRGDILQRLPELTNQQFDRIYFDPPYSSDLYQPVLEAIAHYQILAAGGELAVEHSPKAWTVAPIASLELCRQKVYGNTAIAFYQLPTPEYPSAP